MARKGRHEMGRWRCSHRDRRQVATGRHLAGVLARAAYLDAGSAPPRSCSCARRRWRLEFRRRVDSAEEGIPVPGARALARLPGQVCRRPRATGPQRVLAGGCRLGVPQATALRARRGGVSNRWVAPKPCSSIRDATHTRFRRRPEPFTCEAPHDRGAVLSTDSASGCPGVRPRWHSPRSRHRTAVRPLHPDGCSKRAVPGHRMARLGCPKKRSLHAKGLTPQDRGLQSP